GSLIVLTSCQQNNEQPVSGESAVPTSTENPAPAEKVIPVDTIPKPDSTSFFPESVFGFYKSLTAESALLDDKGQPILNNNGPVIVPATVNYIQLNHGKVYGIQVSNRQRFLFTGFYEPKRGSTPEKGSLSLILQGKSMKNGQALGPWIPEVSYIRNAQGEYRFVLKGTAGAPDAQMNWIFKDKSSRELLDLIDRESKSL
ncbi:MAG: hypothetical protein ACKORE_09935, partial [Bacteroidota bacterium]